MAQAHQVKAAELHGAAAESHRKAAELHGKKDDKAGLEHSKKAETQPEDLGASAARPANELQKHSAGTVRKRTTPTSVDSGVPASP
jgi:hypothetical protein